MLPPEAIVSLESPQPTNGRAVDPVRLRQILLDLLSNACKFTKEGMVTLRRAGLPTVATGLSSRSLTPALA
jgi:signal transduction histidine kinase